MGPGGVPGVPGVGGAGTSTSGPTGGVSGGAGEGWPGCAGSAGGGTGVSGGFCCIAISWPSNDPGVPRVAEPCSPVIGATSSGRARVAELVDALDLGSSIERCGGSSPFARTSSPVPPAPIFEGFE